MPLGTFFIRVRVGPMAGHTRDARGRSAVNLSRVYSLRGHRAESSEPRSCIAHT